MKFIITLLVCISALLQLSSAANVLVIPDEKLEKNLVKKIGDMVDEKKTVSSAIITEQLKRKVVKLKLNAPNKDILEDIYASCVDSVGIIDSVYNCGKCDNWHRTGSATCWALTEDIMVTNYHVFANANHPGWGVTNRRGELSLVTEILAADRISDIAIFRIKGGNFKPLNFGETQKVGGDVHIIAHPAGRYFTYSRGHVTRYSASRVGNGNVWMGVSAEYARGSSGGPVLDSAGNVIGMVANTQSIYYGNAG